MSVLSARELFNGRGAGSIRSNEVSDTRVFRVTVDSSADDHVVILASGFLPSYGDFHPTNPVLRAYEFNWQQESGTSTWWLFRITYKNIPPPTQPKPDEDPDPRERRIIVRVKFSEGRALLTRCPTAGFMTAAEFDGGAGVDVGAIEELPVWSSAFERTDGLEVIQTQGIVEVEWNTDTIPDFVFDYFDTMNDAPCVFFGRTFGAYTLRYGVPEVSDLKTAAVGDEIIEFYTIRFQLLYRRSTWFEPQLDRGYRKYEAPDYVDIIDATGLRPASPVNLDGAGAVLSSTDPADAVFAWYAPYSPVDFGLIPTDS